MTSDGNMFNKLWVIESLSAGELKTGKSLVDNQLNSARQIQPDLDVELTEPVSKAEIFEVLNRIKEASSKGQYPMIHFECHGCEDGLGAASGELIEWDELREVLIEINRNCQLNLMIVIAACSGAHLIKVSTKLDAAPFFAIIGPEVEVTAGDIQINFGNFYKKYFETLNGDDAISVLNKGVERSDRKYKFVSAGGLFSRAYRTYYKSHCIGKAKQQRIEYLVTQAMKNPDVKSRGVAWARTQIKNGLACEDQHFEKLRKRFFFINEYPDNDERFALSREQIIGPDNP